MKTLRKIFYWVLPVCVLTGSVLMFTACESEDSPDTDGLDSYFEEHPYVSDPRITPTDTDVIIEPNAAQASFVGEQIVFTGKGGKGPYTWDVSYSSRGTVRSYGYSQGIYTTRALEPNDVIVYDQNGHAAIASISATNSATPTPTPTVTPTPAALSVSANPTQLDQDGDISVITASGGYSPYTWSVRDVTLGNVDSSSGSSVGYIRADAGDNVVTCTDSKGNTAKVAISQP
jgi:hypothetical protein